jgi:hypothetical protein
LKNDNSLLPLGVLVAIGIFIAREILDCIKENNARKRKVRAFKYLLTEELELNHWAYKSLRRIVKMIEEDTPGATYEIEFREKGNEYICGHDGEEVFVDSPLVVISQKYYDKLITEIAVIDVNLFNVVQDTYEEIRNMAHVRKGLVGRLMAKDFDKTSTDNIQSDGFLDYALKELDDAFESMKNLYMYCTEKELESFRVR